MSTRRLIALLAAVATLGCTTDDAPAAPATALKRTTLIPGPGTIGADYAKDGRLAYGKLIDGKSAIFVSDADGQHARRLSFGVWDYFPTWSPDGKWIAFMRDAGGQRDVLVIPSDSGAERSVAVTGADEQLNGWLPDGSGLLFSRPGAQGRETWEYTLANGSSAKAIDADGGVIGFASPDGKWLAYQLNKNGKSTIWLWDRAKKTARQLTTEGFERLGISPFSPDGKTLLYSSIRTGTGDLWRVDVATGERKQITQDVAEDYNARWSPDGSRILFSSTRGGQPDLWIIATGESDVQRVTDDAVDESDAQWTPDGRSVVASVSLGKIHLYRVPLAGDGKPVALTSGDWDVGTSNLSPDRLRIAYTGTKNGDEDIWVVPVAGGESKLVSGAPGFDGHPNWSPDGKRIAFTSWRGGNPDIWIAPIDSGAAVRLTDWPSAEYRPRYSPDGKTIAFLSDHESAGADLWTMPAAGGAPTRLTKMGTLGNVYRWSPDGKSIAFSAQDGPGGGVRVFVVPSAGGAARPFAPATSYTPEWRPDGRELKVMQCDKGYCTIDIWSAEGKRLRTLSRTDEPVYEFDSFWSTDGSQMLVGWQDFRHDGGNRVDLRSTANGSARTLARPEGFSAQPLGFADSNRTAIIFAQPNGAALQRIDVSSLSVVAKH